MVLESLYMGHEHDLWVKYKLSEHLELRKQFK